MRRALAVSLLALAVPASADAATLRTWDTPSRFVDPAKMQCNAPPPGAPARECKLRVNVLLPDGYDGRRRFPVLYLLHGHGDAFDSWANTERGDAARIAAGLRAILVMPEAAQGWYADWWDGGARGTDGRGWERYFLDELLPLVERRLRIRPGRRNHAIAGLSMGGEGATYLGAQLPGTFGAVGTFSGAISLLRTEWPFAFDTQGQRHVDVFGDPDAQRFNWEGHDPVTLAGTGNLAATRTFVTVGDGTASPERPAELTNGFGQVAEVELRRHAEDFVFAARRGGSDVTYQPRAGIHDWPYWRDALARMVAWNPFRPVPEHPRQWRFATVRQSGRAWNLRFRFAEPPSNLQVLSRDGNVLRASGTGRVRIRVDGRRPFTASLPFRRTIPSRPPRRRR